MKSVVKNLFLLLFLTNVSACTLLPDVITRRDYNTIFIRANINQHIITAADFLGYNERRNRSEIRELIGVDPVQTEWCAAFINAVLDRHNVPGSDSVSENPLMARSFLDWGLPVTEPRRGDIMVFSRGNSNWQGHVGFYLSTVERNGQLYYRILGGNQNNSVNVSEYPVSRLLGIRRINNTRNIAI